MDNCDVELKFREQDKQSLNIILECHGIIFGGYIRDCLADKQPNDIDAMIFISQKENFDERMMKIYSQKLYNKKNGTTVFSGSYLQCEVCYIDNNYIDGNSDDIIDPEPDLDINSLMYSRKDGLKNWVTRDKNIDEIIKHIREGVCMQYVFCESDRLEKIKKNGWIVLDEKIYPPGGKELIEKWKCMGLWYGD